MLFLGALRDNRYVPCRQMHALSHTHSYRFSPECQRACSCLGNNEGPTEGGDEAPTSTKDKPSVLSIGAGLPPVPLKLMKRIHAGEFVDMSGLLPDHLGLNVGPHMDGDKDDKKS